MIKRVVLVRRRPDLDRPAFERHWLEVHSLVARQLPGLRRYCINLPQEGSDPGWDGVGELWFEDREAMDSAFAALGERLAADLALFVDGTSTYVVTEHDVPLV